MDARAQQAREHHKAAVRTSARARARADTLRQRRDQLVRELRAEDPAQWSYGELAKAVGCSKSLIRQILEETPLPRGRAGGGWDTASAPTGI